jgi:hypothetical protein
MNDRTEPAFSLPRSMLRVVAEVHASCGWDRLPPLRQPRVLDMGAGVGAFAVVACEVWPGARLHCFEPRREVHAALVENTRGLAVEHAMSVEPAALGPCDVLRVDARAADLSILGGYAHLARVSVLLVTTQGEKGLAQTRRLAADNGLTGLGEHVGPSGLVTLRFARTELLTRDSVEEPPKIPPSPASRPDVDAIAPVNPGTVPLHLYVSMITGGGKAWSDVEHGLHVLGVLCRQHGVGLTLVRERMTGVDRARNVQTERCLAIVRTEPAAQRPTHMLHLDSDLVFRPEDILKLMRSNLDVSAIVYPRKEIDWDRVVRAVRAGVPPAELPRYAASFVFNSASGNFLRHPELGTFLEVEEVGTGCLMVKVDALHRYVEAYREELEYVSDYDPMYAIHHQFFHCERDPACPRETKLRDLKRAAVTLLRASEGDRPSDAERDAVLDAALAWGRTAGDPTSVGRYLTEDYSFCRRWRLLGGKIYALMEAEVGHIGKHVYRGTLERAVPIRDTPPSRTPK